MLAGHQFVSRIHQCLEIYLHSGILHYTAHHLMSSKRILRSDDLHPTTSLDSSSDPQSKGQEGDKPSHARGRKRRSGQDLAPSTPRRARLATNDGTELRAGAPRVKQASYENDVQNAPEGSYERLAAPHWTNAPLVTPRGSRLTTKAKGDQESSSNSGHAPPVTTTIHILDLACEHLIKVDSRMRPLIDKHRCTVFGPEGLAEECDPFRNLCSGIMSQQVSGAAASSIKRKFVRLFNDVTASEKDLDGTFPDPTQVAACDTSFLRQAGLSGRKAEYIKGLAEKFASGELSAAMLINASDEEILHKLTAVRGLGKWSVEMFACFGLKRMDILSTGDLGVQ